jgi:hypothetical protein
MEVSFLRPTSKDIEEFLHEGETGEAFVTRVSATLGTKEEHKWAAVLALFGWEPLDNLSEWKKVLMMHCSTCLAQGRLHVQDTNDTGIAPPAKRQRVEERLFNPILCHRHYCPFVCGFPSEGTTVPMWQTIATNLFRTEESAENEETGIGSKEEILMKIHCTVRPATNIVQSIWGMASTTAKCTLFMYKRLHGFEQLKESCSFLNAGKFNAKCLNFIIKILFESERHNMVSFH